METFHITISETQKGTPWQRTLIKEYDIQSDPSECYKAIAQEIIKLDLSPYRNGLYVRAVNENNECQSYLLVPTVDDGKNSFFVRNGNPHWGGFDNSYSDYSEKKRYLVCLDEEANDYKSYTMFQEQGNGRFGVSYGRIGGTDLLDKSKYNFDKEGSHYYPSDMFWIKYYEKIMKGYIDKTEEMDIEYTKVGPYQSVKTNTKPKELTDYKPIEEDETRSLIEFLISRQREYVQQNYYYNRSEVNTSLNSKAIEHSDVLLNKMSEIANKVMKGFENNVSDDCLEQLDNEFRECYKELLITLPRKIGNVKKYIDRVNFIDETSPDYVTHVIDEERDLLNALRDVKQFDEGKIHDTINNKTILEACGLEAKAADYKDRFDVLEKMGEKAHSASRILAVKNERTAKAYEKCCKDMSIEKRGCHLLWHGSRTENWWSIFKNGMSLNPNAITTGKMFGQGLYFAPKASKSMGYVDMQGSYWAHGTQNTGYLALFEVAMGKPYELKDGWLDSNFSFKDLKYGCHSVWAKEGKTLRNDECIIYNENQCDIRYLVEVDYNRQKDFSINIKKVRNLRFTNLELEDYCLIANVPNFKTCTGIPSRGVTIGYDLINDTVFFPNSTVSSVLNETDKEFIEDVFKSKLADNSREFSKLCDTIIAEGYIPADILCRINKENKAMKKDNVEKG